MTKVMLVQPPWSILHNTQNETLWLGLGYIAAALKRAGHEIMIFNGEPPDQEDLGDGRYTVDINFYKHAHQLTNPIWERFRGALKLFQPDIVGISIWTAAYQSAANIARLSKEYNPNISVIAGGIHATLLPMEVLKDNTDIDYVVIGEGEETVIELVSCLESGLDLDKVRGICFRKGDNIVKTSPRQYIEDLDNLPFPDFSGVLNRDLYHPNGYGGILTSRGCPFLCSYCASNLLWGRKVRFRSPEGVVDEIAERIRLYKTSYFRFNDDSFTVNRERVLRICDLILERKLKIGWHCDTRVELIDEDLLKKMKKAGCNQINIGAESGSEEILKSIGKNISLKQIKDAVKIIKSVGLKVTVYFMVGFPGETVDQVSESIALMEELKPNIPCWSIVTPYPGTEIYEFAKREKTLPQGNDWSLYFHHTSVMKLTNAITSADWFNLLEEIEIRSEKIIRLNKGKIENIKDLIRKLLIKTNTYLILKPVYNSIKTIVWKMGGHKCQLPA